MKTILTNKHISIETRKRALQCYIEPVLKYGCEAWTISKQIQIKLEATEMWFLRRMLRIPWTAKKTNERVLNGANKIRSLVRTISRTTSLTEKLLFLLFVMPPFAAGLPRVGEGHEDSKGLPAFGGLDIVMRANATSL
ncbi:RNA-directed DNA polymerase from mobile element jockey [Plakobranchus ocellatus]|uniref:RNA-directed DNA polymerase from mobile element jockey n=1 Tax=Plakobranchus ocellatus TaxID=259542 RepID=A0AAV4DZ28_9GAST|nr:RNA-directed DNA polymerase from mobile element jockey [Plakobranchus ocellatus]